MKVKAKANELAEAKHKFKALLSQSDSGILTKSEALDKLLNELEEVMKKRKTVRSNLYKLETEVTSAELSYKYIEIENEVKDMGKYAESDRIQHL